MGEVPIGDLAKAVSLGQATVTGIIDRLEARSLVTRNRSTEDRRKVLVRTTPSCEQLLAAAPPFLQESFQVRFQKLEEWEQLMILAALMRLGSLMEARKGEIAPFLYEEDGETVV